MSRTRAGRTLQIALVGIALLGACKKDSTTLTYDQVGACNGYSQTAGTGGPGQLISAGQGQVYVVFHVTSIDNSKSSVAFNFDPAKEYVNSTSPRAHIDPSLGFATDLGVLTVVPITVAPGKIVPIHGFAVAVVPGSSSEASKTSYFLGYDTGDNDPSLFMTKSNSGQTSWVQTDNCRSINLKL